MRREMHELETAVRSALETAPSLWRWEGVLATHEVQRRPGAPRHLFRATDGERVFESGTIGACASDVLCLVHLRRARLGLHTEDVVDFVPKESARAGGVVYRMRPPRLARVLGFLHRGDALVSDLHVGGQADLLLDAEHPVSFLDKVSVGVPVYPTNPVQVTVRSATSNFALSTRVSPIETPRST